VDARIDPDSRSRPRRIGDWLRRARAEIRADRDGAIARMVTWGLTRASTTGLSRAPPPPGRTLGAGAGRDARSIAHARRARASVAPRPDRAAPRRGAPRATRPALAGAADIHPRRARALFRCRSRPPRRSGRASRPAPSLAPRVAPALRARHAPRAPPPRPAPPRRARRPPRGSRRRATIIIITPTRRARRRRRRRRPGAPAAAAPLARGARFSPPSPRRS